MPFLWILWAPWETARSLRQTAYEDNFYDLQARAMFHGHLWLANGSIGIEAFVHGGRQYTYFGLFPSLIRMPILVFTSSLDGKLTAPFMLPAGCSPALFASLLLWRVRLLVRGQVVMGRAEATAFGVLMATVMGGSVFTVLAATPYVFDEDLAWSICLTVGSLFALLGVLERPSWGRVVVSGRAHPVRQPRPGHHRVGLCRRRRAHRRLVRTRPGRYRRTPVVRPGAGRRPRPPGGRMRRQLRQVRRPLRRVQLTTRSGPTSTPTGASSWPPTTTPRRASTFIPSNVLAYLRPDGLRFTSVFPFVTLPAAPPTRPGGVLFDRRYRTASLPSSMPLLFLLSCWGLVTAFRPKPIGQVALTRILLLAAGCAGAALFSGGTSRRGTWPTSSPSGAGQRRGPGRHLAPAGGPEPLGRGSGPGGHRPGRPVHASPPTSGSPSSPTRSGTPTQVLNYVEAQNSISDVTGHPLEANVVRGSSLPPWAPADQLYVIGDCDGLYISNGENYSTVPSQQFTRTTWMAVERGHAFEHTFRVTVAHAVSGGPASRSHWSRRATTRWM